MLGIHLHGNYLEMYDSIDELPFSRFQEYNRAILLDSGLGADLEAIVRHITQARKYNAAGKVEQADQALINMQQAISFTLEKVSPEAMAFVALIHRMNGKEVENLSHDSVKKITDELSRRGLTVGKVRGFLAYVKKKLMKNSTPFSQN